MQPKKQEKSAKAPVKTPGISFKKQGIFIVAGAIALLTYLTLSPVLKNNFSNWDDNGYVFENTHLNKSLPEAVTYFFGPHYFIGNYIPVTMTVYAVTYKLSGLDPADYHRLNLLIHCLNVLLVFWFIYLLSGRKMLVAGFVSLLFGIHPMHVESVAWIAELKDLLYTAFYVGGLICYYRYLDYRRSGSLETKRTFKLFVYTFLLFTLSVLSKPAAVTFPVVMLLLDYFTNRGRSRLMWMEKLPFLILSIVLGLVAVNAQRADSLLHDYYPVWERALFASHSLLSYIAKMFLPLKLANFYPYPASHGGKLPVEFYLAPAGVVLLLVILFRSFKSSRLVFFGLAFFLVNVVLVLQLLSIGDAIKAERYTYLSYTGLFFTLAVWLDKFYLSEKKRIKSLKPMMSMVLGIWLLLFIYKSHERTKVWRTDDIIASDLMSKFPDDRLVLNNKAYVLMEQGRHAEAVDLLKRAIELRPDYIRAYVNLANSYVMLNMPDEAMTTVNKALEHAPDDTNLMNLKGRIYFLSKNYPESVRWFTKSIAIKDNDAYSHVFLAECYAAQNDYDKAIAITDEGIKKVPRNHFLLNNKGYYLFVKGRYSEALQYLRTAVALNPDFKLAHENIDLCNRAIADSIASQR